MSRSWTSAFHKALAAVTVVLIVVAAVELLRPKPYNVIILTVDSLRASDFTPQTAPVFHAVMRDAYTPRTHRTVSAWTAPNIIAVLTGISPFDQGVHARGQFLSDRVRTPLAALAERGWDIGNTQAFAKADVFRNMGVMVDTAVDWKGWIAQRLRFRTPFVLWHHYLDVHLPYSPSSATIVPQVSAASPKQQARIDVVRTRSAIPVGSVAFKPSDAPLIHKLYLGGIEEFDKWFADFWDVFTGMGLDRDTILVVTADHGDELLERGRVGHASTTHDASLHEEIVNIPLFILLPERHPLRQVNWSDKAAAATDHLDIMPTVFGLLGEEPPQSLAGRDLTVDSTPRPWLAYSSKGGYAEPNPDDIRSYVGAILDGGTKLIVRIEDGRVIPQGVYDLSSDPYEHTNRLHGADALKSDPAVRRMLGDAGVGRLAAHIASARRFALAPSTAAGTALPPTLLWPQPNSVLSYEDLRGQFAIRWTGNTEAQYVLGYEIGEKPFFLSGEMRITGTVKDFGEIDRHYWRTWVLPYRKARIRLRRDGSGEWGPWATFVFQDDQPGGVAR